MTPAETREKIAEAVLFFMRGRVLLLDARNGNPEQRENWPIEEAYLAAGKAMSQCHKALTELEGKD